MTLNFRYYPSPLLLLLFWLTNMKRVKRKMLNQSQFATLFGNVLVLVQLNESFLSELSLKIVKREFEALQKGEITEDTKHKICVVRNQVSEVFIQFSPLFRMYKNYIANLNDALKILADLKTNEAFSQFMRQTVDPSARLTIDDYLIMPMQRIPRYVLLLQQLQKHTLPSDPSYSGISKSIDIFKEVADTLNASVSEKEKNSKMKTIYLQLCDYPKDTFGNLIQPQRKFIKEGELFWMNGPPQRNHNSLWVILFNDIILLSLKGEHVLQYIGQLTLSDTKVTALKMLNSKHLFQISARGFHFVLATNTEEEQKEWMDAINKMIDERISKQDKKLRKSKETKRDRSNTSAKKLGDLLAKSTPEVQKKVVGDNMKGLLAPMASKEYKARTQTATTRVVPKSNYNMEVIQDALQFVAPKEINERLLTPLEKFSSERELSEHLNQVLDVVKSVQQKINGLQKVASSFSLSQTPNSEEESVLKDLKQEISHLKTIFPFLKDREEQVKAILENRSKAAEGKSDPQTASVSAIPLTEVLPDEEDESTTDEDQTNANTEGVKVSDSVDSSAVESSSTSNLRSNFSFTIDSGLVNDEKEEKNSKSANTAALKSHGHRREPSKDNPFSTSPRKLDASDNSSVGDKEEDTTDDDDVVVDELEGINNVSDLLNESTEEEKQEADFVTPPLPKSVVQNIFRCCCPKELATVAIVCKEWNSWATEEKLWKLKCEENFPELIEKVRHHSVGNWREMCVAAANLLSDCLYSEELAKLVEEISRVEVADFEHHLDAWIQRHPLNFQRISVGDTCQNLLAHFLDNDFEEERTLRIVKLLVTKYNMDVNLPCKKKNDKEHWWFPVELALENYSTHKKVLSWLFSQPNYIKFVPFDVASRMIEEGDDDKLFVLWDKFSIEKQNEVLVMEIMKNPTSPFTRTLEKCLPSLSKDNIDLALCALYEIPIKMDDSGKKFLEFDEASPQKSQTLARRKKLNLNRRSIAGMLFHFGADPFVQSKETGMNSFLWIKARSLLCAQDATDSTITVPLDKMSAAWLKKQTKSDFKKVEIKEICRNCLCLYSKDHSNTCIFHQGGLKVYEHKDSGDYLGGVPIYEYKETWDCCEKLRVHTFQNKSQIFPVHQTGCTISQEHSPIPL